MVFLLERRVCGEGEKPFYTVSGKDVLTVLISFAGSHSNTWRENLVSTEHRIICYLGHAFDDGPVTGGEF